MIQKITYLEKKLPAVNIPAPSAYEDVFVRQVAYVPVGFYRYLYCAVGIQWSWRRRYSLTDNELKKILQADNVKIYLLYSQGIPAGFAECHIATEGDVELVYFGLLPDYIGKQYGRFFLYHVVEHISQISDNQRLWLQTKSTDHPNAIRVYQSLGFSVFRETVLCE